MPILTTAAQIATEPFPKAISPKAHSVIDYMTAGSFLATAAWFWGRNKRAAVAALICGGAELAISLLTNYPGGVKKVINFRTHRDIDLALAAMTSTMPEFLAFKRESERRFFLAEGAMIAAVTEMTRFPEKSLREEIRGVTQLPSLWKFGGLTPLGLIQLAIRKLGQDELSTRSASLSYYFLLALFPLFLFLVSLLGVFAGRGPSCRKTLSLHWADSLRVRLRIWFAWWFARPLSTAVE